MSKGWPDSKIFNKDAFIFDSQVLIRDTTNASISAGSLVVSGGLSTKDTYVEGHVAVNNVKITPNLNDIIHEQQAVLAQSITEWTDITDFSFNNSTTTSFKAFINVTVAAGVSKYAIWELNGLYKPSGWSITSTFTGDLTNVNFRCINKSGVGQIQFTNSNGEGSTTTIRYRASTTAPIGTTPTGSTGIINNTNGPYVANTLLYSNTINTLASTDLVYNSNVFKVGPASRLVSENASSFTNFSNGGSISALGDSSVAKNLIVGQKIGIANTAPSFTLDVAGDINFTGNFYKNNSLYSGSSIWDTNENGVFNTTSNVGIGTTNPSSKLDVNGTITATAYTGTNLSLSGTVKAVTSSVANMHASIGTISNLASTNLSSGTLNGASGTITNIVSTNVSSGTLNLSIGITSASAQITDANITNLTASNLKTSNFTSTDFVTTNVSVGTLVGTSVSAANVYGSLGTITNMVTTNISSGTLSGTSATISNVNATAISAGNIVGTTVSTANVHASVGTVNNFVASTNLSTGTISATTVSAANVYGSSGTVSNFVGTNLSTSNLSVLTDISMGLTNTNVTSNNVVSINQPSSYALRLGSNNQFRPNIVISSQDRFLDTGRVAVRFSSFASYEHVDGTNATFILTVQSSGNVGIGTSTPSNTLDVSGTGRITTSLTTGALFSTDQTTTNIVATNLSSGNISSTTMSTSNVYASLGTISNLVGTNLSSSNLVATTSTITNLNVPGTLTVVNITSTNLTVSAGNIVGTTLTVGNIYASLGTVSNFVASSNLSAGTLVGTTISTANIYGSLGTVGNFVASSNLSAGNLVGTTVSTANVYGSLGTVSNFVASSNLSAGNLVGTTISTTNVYASVGTISNFVGTAISAGTLVGTTVSVGNVHASIGTVSNFVGTTISASTLVATASTVPNMVHTTVSAGTFVGTTVSATNVYASVGTVSNFVGTTLSTGTLVGTTVSAANIHASSGTVSNFVGTTLSSSNLVATTSTIPNIVHTNITANSIIVTGGTLNATFNSNTIGNIYTTAGNVGINRTNPQVSLDVNGDVSANSYTGGNINVSGTMGANVIAIGGISEFTLSRQSGYKQIQSLNSEPLILNALGNNVGIATTTPAATFDVNGGIRATNMSSGTINLSTGLTAASAQITNIESTNSTVTNLLIRGDVNFNTVGGLQAYINIQDNQVLRFGSNSSVKTHVLVTGDTFSGQLGRITGRYANYVSFDAIDNGTLIERMRLNSAGNLGIGTNNPSNTLDVSGTGRITTSLTTGALFSTNQTTTNIVATNLSSGNVSTTTMSAANVHSASGTISNFVGTNLSSGTFSGTSGTISNFVGTTLSSGTLVGTTLSTANVYASLGTITNLVSTNLSSGTFSGTSGTISNFVGTTLSSGTLVGTTLSTANVYASLGTVSNLVGTTLSSSNLVATTSTVPNMVHTNLSSGTLVGTTLSAANIYASLGTVSNFVGTTLSAGTFVATTSTIPNMVHTNLSSGTLVGTTLSTANVYASSGTVSNFVSTTLSSGTLRLSSTTDTSNTTIGALVIAGGLGLTKALTLGSYVRTEMTNSDASFDAPVDATWWYLGKFDGGSGGETCYIEINAGVGYNGDPTQNASTIIHLRSGNGLGTNIGATWSRFGASNLFMAAQVSSESTGNVSTARDWDVYIQQVNRFSGRPVIKIHTGNNASFVTSYTTVGSVSATNGTTVISATDSYVIRTPFTALSNSNTIGALVTTGGNVGIGTTAPGMRLDVSGTGRITTSLTTGALFSTNQTTTNIVATTISAGTLLGTNVSAAVGTITNLLTTNQTTASICASTGNLLLGVMNGLGVAGSVRIGRNDGFSTIRYHDLECATSTTQASSYMAVKLHNGSTTTSQTEVMRLRADGNIGIGTTAPAYQLQLSTDSAAKPSTNTWTIASDERLKTNIELADLDICYNLVKNLPLKRYTWRDDVYTAEQVPDRSKLGWIAQDVEVVMPKAVESKEMFGYEDCRTLNSDQLIASLYGAVQKIIQMMESNNN